MPRPPATTPRVKAPTNTGAPRVWVLRDGEPAASLAVLSPQAQDGKSFLSANLAVAWSQAGRRTLLVDADLPIALLTLLRPWMASVVWAPILMMMPGMEPAISATLRCTSR
jgi:hypothetical protein